MSGIRQDLEALAAWALQLTGGRPVKLQECRPGEIVVAGGWYREGVNGDGTTRPQALAIFPSVEWVEAKYTGDGRQLARATGDYRLAEPTTEPTLISLLCSGNGETETTYLLALPVGDETAEQYRARCRRQFAEGARIRLAAYGLTLPQMEALIRAASISQAVAAAQLARQAVAACGGTAKALHLLQQVQAAGDPASRLKLLREAGVEYREGTASRFGAKLRAAIALLQLPSVVFV
ncbi:MAG TPA: hypothetical protein VLI05_00260 [Candidatus Saccharimonadia bacterium]|nr:hypothetical protein [Candidatus Saccharimonadia bacterium]